MASFAKLRRTRRGEKSWICLILRVKGRYKLAKLKIKSLCEIVDAKLYCATYIIKEKKHIYLGIYTHFHICLENNGRRWLPSSVWRHGDLGRPLSLLSQHRRPAKRIYHLIWFLHAFIFDNPKPTSIMSDDAAAPAPAVKAAKAKKPAAPKKPAEHPKYAVMVSAAVAALKERGGSSRQAILKYIIANYKVGDNPTAVNARVKTALKAGVKAGSLKQSKGTGAAGSFKLGEKPKVAKKPKKKVVKKPKSPKKATKPKKAAAKKSPKKAAKSPAKKAAKKPAAKKAAKSPAKKAAKKPAAKKPAAKKPAAKKAAAKKPAAKKAAKK